MSICPVQRVGLCSHTSAVSSTCSCSEWFFSFSWFSTAASPSPAWILAHRSSLSASSWFTLSLLFCSRASRFWIFWSLSPIWRNTCSRSFCIGQRNTSFHKNIKQHIYKAFSQMKIMPNNSWKPKQHIRMFSEGPCDTEDWSKGCWKYSFAITEIN